MANSIYPGGIFSSAIPTVVILEDRKTTNGGAFTADIDQVRDLNTVASPQPWLTLAANQFTLQPGRYYVSFSAPAFFVHQHQVWLQDVTDGSQYLGTSEYCAPTDGVSSRSYGSTVFSIDTPHAYELRHRCATGKTNNGLGLDSSGTTGAAYSVYARVEVWRLGD